MAERFGVAVSAGSLRVEGGVSMPHAWTAEGVSIEGAFTGAHVLHLSVAGCVLNDLYREAERLGLSINGARVRAWGTFDPETWSSEGISYDVALDSSLRDADIATLLATVDDVAEVPKALRAGTTVRRTDV
jgi:hypothetical protein